MADFRENLVFGKSFLGRNRRLSRWKSLSPQDTKQVFQTGLVLGFVRRYSLFVLACLAMAIRDI